MNLKLFFSISCVVLLFGSCRHQSHSNLSGNVSSHQSHSIKTEKKMPIIKKPHRISHSYEQLINGTPKQIMPLYCPVRELDWCENWNPNLVISNSGLVEKDCIFTTPHGNKNIVWYVSDYDMENFHVEMIYIVPEILVTKLEIQLTPISVQKTGAELIYTKTSLSKKGDEFLKEFTESSYNKMMESWEKAMNHYLKTGEKLCGLPNF